MNPASRLPRGVVAVTLIGAAARLIPYFRRPSFSFDEAMLSISIASRSFGGLLRPLEYGQTAPPLYLWLTKAVTVVAGVNELALRALPLLGGLLLPWAFWRLARRILPEGAALFASLVVALAPGLVQYSAIVKPYALDALVTVVLLDRALTARETDDSRSWAWLVGAGAVAACLSTPALFVLAAIGICLAIAKWRTRWAWLGLAALCWLGLFAAIYQGMYRTAAGSPFMQRFWAPDFLVPRAFGFHGRAYGILRNSFLEALLLRPSPAVAATLFCLVALLGIIWLVRRTGWGRTWLIAGPVVMTVVASSFRRYPFSWRLLQFTMPLVALWIAAAGAWLSEALQRWPRGRSTVPGLGALVALLLLTVNVSHPYRTPATRDLISDWKSRANPQDPVYVFQGSVPAWVIYTADWAGLDSAWMKALVTVGDTPQADLTVTRSGRREIIGHYAGIDWFPAGGATRPRVDPAWAGHEAHRILHAGGPDVWLLFAQTYRDEASSLLHALADSGMTRVYADSVSGAALYRYRR
ncbi:MAG TPA: glycosyltransferase family 39 protein [Gemmatimonadales bacterium]|nr:glycosyltransferase family 39 protein [Gemmatimonadales bacterium]